MIRRDFRSPVRLLCALAACGLLFTGCGDGGPSAVEAMASDPDEQLPEGYKPKKRVRPGDGLPPPTDAEFKAWDRKDPEGEKHLYKWDKRSLDKMENYWKQLQCFRERMKLEGDKALGSEPLSPEQEKWEQFKAGFIPFINRWQQRLFANEPRILEKSKFIGHILEAHELTMYGYPKAYNYGDDLELKKADAHWLVVEDKVLRYVDRLGGKWDQPDLTDPKQKEKWDEFCVEAFTEPKDDGKKKKVRKKSPI
jgi:hypothetical protein